MQADNAEQKSWEQGAGSIPRAVDCYIAQRVPRHYSWYRLQLSVPRADRCSVSSSAGPHALEGST